MSSLPDNWIDKLFELMDQFFGNRWRQRFKNNIQFDLYKTIWYNGLNGLSYEEVKNGLIMCKKLSKDNNFNPPSVVAFYHYCKNIPYNVLRRTSIERKKYTPQSP